MPKSKVNSVTFNREWRRDNGSSVFYFDITFDDGTQGQFGTVRREQSKFIIGTEVEYEIRGQNKRGQNTIDLVKEKPQFKSTYNDPTNNLKIAMSVCFSAAVDTAVMMKVEEPTEDDIRRIAIFYYKWVTDCPNERDVLSLRWNSLLNATKYMTLFENTNSKGIVETANVFYDNLENTTLPVHEAS